MFRDGYNGNLTKCSQPAEKEIDQARELDHRKKLDKTNKANSSVRRKQVRFDSGTLVYTQDSQSRKFQPK